VRPGQGSAGGLPKHAYGLSGMFTRHRLSSAKQPACPHALGTDTLSPEWSKLFRHNLCYRRSVRLVRSAWSLSAGSACLPTTKAAESLSQAWNGCVEAACLT
jgi:hypothetical protein